MRTLLYIASPSYSGSTLLTFLLAAHDRIATIGELKASSMGRIEGYRCSCGALIRECRFWTRLTGRLAERGVHFDLANFGTHFRAPGVLADKILTARLRGPVFEAARSFALRRSPGLARRLSEIRERNRALIEAICEIHGGEVFLDGSKDPLRLKFLLEAGHWDVRVVHLTRDGRGSCNSFMRAYFAPMRAAAAEWKATNEGCEGILGGLPGDKWLRLRYEDLCADPQEALAAVYGLAGLSAPPPLEDFRAIEHHILGNAMRLRPVGSIQQDEKWRKLLSREDLAVFERVAGALNRRYGYAAA